jgi:hypothetical protein
MAASVRNILRRGDNVASVVLLLLFTLPWSGITLMADFGFVRGVWCQVRALGYATTAGVVTKSEVVTARTRHRRNYYGPHVEYKYSVAGKEYSGHRYRLEEDASFDSTAQTIVADHPVGKQVTVYYNRADPADSVLRPGLEGSDFFLSMVALPFNLIMLCLWAAVGRGIGRLVAGPSPGGAKIWDDGFVVRVRFAQGMPLIAASFVAGAMAFVLAFVVVFGFGTAHPPLPVMLAVWLLIVVGGVIGWRFGKSAQDGFDLVIDMTARTLALPTPRGRGPHVVVRIRDITAIEVEPFEKQGSPWYAATVVFTGPGGATDRGRLTEVQERSRAEELVAWLRGRLGLKSAADSGGDDAPGRRWNS